MNREEKINRDKIIEEVSNHPAGKVKIAITDIDGIMRGKFIHKEKFLSILDGGFGFCNVIFGWDAADVCYDNGDYTGWHSGYPDAKAFLDLSTYRNVPWNHDVPFFLGDFCDDSGEPLEICPRSLLKKVRAQAYEMGYKPVFAQEFEWFNFQETPEELHAKGHVNPTPITPGMFGYSILRSSRKQEFFNDLFELLGKFKIPIEALHTETGPGTYEAAILYDEILESADRATLFKTSVKEIGIKHGIIPTFMAKWHNDLPGCGGHIHQSIWDAKGEKNLFYEEKAKNHMTDFMKSYLAGIFRCLPEILPMFAPTINSYKRLVEGAWAPTTLTWGIDNRTTAVRVLPIGPKSSRLEFRVPGADVNPYLAMAACLASGLYGVKNNLSLDIEMTKGNGYLNDKGGTLSRTLDQATQKMKESTIARELFGDTFVNHFTQTRDWEWREHLKAVTDWEMKRYFELI